MNTSNVSLISDSSGILLSHHAQTNTGVHPKYCDVLCWGCSSQTTDKFGVVADNWVISLISAEFVFRATILNVSKNEN